MVQSFSIVNPKRPCPAGSGESGSDGNGELERTAAFTAGTKHTAESS